jgi:phospholipid/cholesterol/gamma-HCH transport system ATP-binding protein
MRADRSNASPVIEVENLVAKYNDREILHGVSMEVYEKEIMVIMGGSGSGKSTLLRYILGLESPAGGCIRIFGKDIHQLPSQELDALREKIGVSFQGGALFSSLTVGENIMLPLDEHTDLDLNTKQVMVRMKLEIIGLAGCEHFMPDELSGGMIKRAALARAIIMDPKLLFFDEPSAGLDPVVSASLDELILKLNSALGITIVVVTHELSSAFHIADRIVVLDKGEMLITGTVEEVKNSSNARVQNLLNRRFEEEETDADAYLRRLAGQRPVAGAAS